MIRESAQSVLALPNKLERTVLALLGIISVILLTAAGAESRIYLPFTPVPITMQSFAVMFGSVVLGGHRGAIAMLAYLALGLGGLPIFAGTLSFTPYLLGPTGGYLIGFFIAAWFVGRAVSSRRNASFLQITLIMCAGTFLLYIPGVVQLQLWTGASWTATLMMGVVPFLPGAVLKILAAAALYRPLQGKLRNVLP